MVGNDGTIITTSDAGASFTPETSGTTQLLTSVAFRDASHGWVAGTYGTLLATADGGSTWASQTNPDPSLYDLNGIAFSDTGHGWAVGKNGTILATVDGGAHWALQASGTTARGCQFFCVSDLTWLSVTVTPIVSTSDSQIAVLGRRSPKWILNAASAEFQL
jgi:photosystem II stability/assembly factor-like uncharacterized protein